MKYRILTTLGILVATTGLANSVQAQPAVAINSQAEEFTRSGQSLSSIEPRTIKDDFEKFFLEDSSTLVLNNAEDVSSLNFNPGVGSTWGIAENVRLVVNQPLVEPTGVVSFRQDLPYDGVERVKLQVELDNLNE